MKERKLIAVDFDGTLTDGKARWWKDEIPERNEKGIKWVNEQYKKRDIIIIHTARPWSVAPKTIAWLIENNIKYHGVNFGKMSSDIYLDDKALNIEDIE